MATLDKLYKDVPAAIYCDESFLDVLEDHMTYLRTAATTHTLSVTPSDANVYAFDLSGLLFKLGIPARLHWVIARMNGFKSLTENDETLTQLIVPDALTVDNIASLQSSALVKLAAGVKSTT